MIIFISGGVRSGKSSFAIQLAEKHVKETGRIHYIATSNRTDKEMEARIQRHIKEREERTKEFVTHEKNTNIEEVFGQFKTNDVVLLDCLTGLITGEFFYGIEEGVESWRDPKFQEQLLVRLVQTFEQLQQLHHPVIIVTNELFEDIIPNDESTTAFMKLCGLLHQKIVAISSEAYLVEAGIPLVKKEVGNK